jgi:hypothetical protein
MRFSQQNYYRGVRMVPYDLVKEALIAFVILLVLVAALASVFSSPDEPPITVQEVAQQTPVAFLQQAVNHLDQSSEIATYGPPYNHGTDSIQYVGPVSFQQLFGVWIPINAKNDFVLDPLRQVALNDPRLAQELATFQAASTQQQSQWITAYSDALQKATVQGGQVIVPAGNYGPVGPMMQRMLEMGQSGALDGLLLITSHFYQTDYTKPLLFLAGDPFESKAEQLHLLDTQWGVMNETGSYPGQSWLWLYTFWEQVPQYANSPNADANIWFTMAMATLLLILVPFIPGLNKLPRYLGVHRLIWRDHYRERREELDRQRGGQTS